MDRLALAVGQVEELPRRARRDEAVDALRREPQRVRPQLREVHAPARVERREQGDEEPHAATLTPGPFIRDGPRGTMERGEAMSRTILVIAPVLVVVAACKSDRNLSEADLHRHVRAGAEQPGRHPVGRRRLRADDRGAGDPRERLRVVREPLDESRTEFQLGVISTSFDYGDTARGVLKGNPPTSRPPTTTRPSSPPARPSARAAPTRRRASRPPCTRSSRR